MGWLDRLRGAGVAPESMSGPLRDLAELPGWARDTPLSEVTLLALDVEATGLDPRRHELLSFGFLTVEAGRVVLAGARHLPVRPRGEVGDSAVLHGLTDDALAAAPPLADQLPEVLRAFGVEGRRAVLLAHFAQVEGRYLTEACRRLYGGVPELQVVDTLEIERRMLGAERHELMSGLVRLDACRRRRGLPRYRAHSAVTDALACAELFLAQAAELEERLGRPPRLADVLQRRPW